MLHGLEPRYVCITMYVVEDSCNLCAAPLSTWQETQSLACNLLSVDKLLNRGCLHWYVVKHHDVLLRTVQDFKYLTYNPCIFTFLSH